MGARASPVARFVLVDSRRWCTGWPLASAYGGEQLTEAQVGFGAWRDTPHIGGGEIPVVTEALSSRSPKGVTILCVGDDGLCL
jgi:hypothetical protein